PGEVEVIHLPGKEGPVQRPFCQGNLEVSDLAGVRLARRVGRHGQVRSETQEGSARERAFQEEATTDAGVTHRTRLLTRDHRNHEDHQKSGSYPDGFTDSRIVMERPRLVGRSLS